MFCQLSPGPISWSFLLENYRFPYKLNNPMDYINLYTIVACPERKASALGTHTIQHYLKKNDASAASWPMLTLSVRRRSELR
jgi:hypothetical protein